MLLGDGLYGGFAIGGGFAQGVARTVITTAVVAVVGGLIAKLREFTVRSARKNRQLSELDALTGVGNVRALRHRVSRVIERADSTGLHPALVAIDLDGFKQVNDLYSHSTGDQVLVAVARAVSDHVQIEELVARRGGDEFVVVLRDADPRYADTVARRIGAAISRSRARICPDLQPTASIASIRWRPGETAEEFLRGADLALHERKAESRASGREEPAMAGSTRSASRRSTDGRASTSSTAGRGAGALATAIAHAHGSGNGCTSMPAGRSRRPSS
jgi:diguanylate cyclase (GGDEF)-like protein